jgi:predicted HicB family RNase H-like nuclease
MPRTKSQTAFRLDQELMERLRKEARKQNRSINNLVETILLNHFKK